MSQADEPGPDKRLEQLEAEVRDLQAENTRLNAVVGTDLKAVSWGNRLAVLIVLGPRLASSIRRWLQATKDGPGIPDVETAEVMAAVVRRLIGNRMILIVGGMLAAIAGAVGAVLLYQQNSLFADQLEQQAEEAQTVRRTQLLALIYDKQPTEFGSLPVASLRARAEAARAFVALERMRLCGSDIAVGEACSAEVDLSDVELSRADLRGASLYEVILRGADLERAQLGLADLHGANLEDASLRRAVLNQAVLSEGVLPRADLTAAELVGTDLRRAELRGADLTGAFLSEADLQGAILTGADFTGADLTGAILTGAVLRSTYFRQADMRGAVLSGADLSEAVLTGAALTNACVDSTTSWPADFDREAAGVVPCGP